MLNSTLRDTLSDRLWDQNQARETRFIAAQETARAASLTVATILTDYQFTRDEYNTLRGADGAVTQVAMRVVSKTDVNDRYLVIAKINGTELDWSAYCPPLGQDKGTVFIQAVQARIKAVQAAKKGVN